MTKNTTSKRGVIKQLLNRETVYNLSDYSRKVTKIVGKPITIIGVVKALGAMSREGQLFFHINGIKVHGCLNFGRKAFQIV